MKYIPAILKRKKFQATLAAAILACVGAYAGAITWKEAIIAIITCVSVAVGSQGVADHGKEAEKVRAQAASDARDAVARATADKAAAERAEALAGDLK